MSRRLRPLVTILMNSRDGDPSYLAAAVRSVLWQTYPRIELIVAEASAGPGARQVLESFRDPRLTVICDEDRQGWAHGANLATAHAQGTYLAFVACDDICHPQMVEGMVRALERSGAGTAVVPVRGIDSSGAPLGKNITVPAFVRAEPTWVRLFERNYVIFALSRREVLPDPLIDESLTGVGGDWDVWLKLAQAGTGFVYHDELLFDYRVHDRSLVARSADTRGDMRRVLARYPLSDIEALYRRAGIDSSTIELAMAAIDILFGRYEDALQRWLRTSDRETDPSHRCFQIGTLELLLGHTREACALLREAVTRNEAAPESWNNLGVCYGRLGRAADRRECLERALSLFPLYQDGRRNLEQGTSLVTERRLRPVTEILR